jgi:hypothetical protein
MNKPMRIDQFIQIYIDTCILREKIVGGYTKMLHALPKSSSERSQGPGSSKLME